MYIDYECPNCKKLTTGMVVDEYWDNLNEDSLKVSNYREIQCMDCGQVEQFEYIYGVTLELEEIKKEDYGIHE